MTKPRVGAPRTSPAAQVVAIIVKVPEKSPPSGTHWGTRPMAMAAGMSHTMAGRFWRTFGLQPRRTERFEAPALGLERLAVEGWVVRWLVCCIAATIIVLPRVASAQDVRSIPELPQVVPNRYIVVLRDGPAARNQVSRAAVAGSLARVAGGRVLRVYEQVLDGFALEMTPAAAQRLAADPRVAYVEPDRVVYALDTQLGAPWGIDRIDQRDLPLSTSYTYSATGQNVHAYIIDTGILATHDEFAGRMGNDFTAVNDGHGTNDCNGHGTHVAGTVGGTTWGVAKRVTLHAVRVLDCDGVGSWSGVIAGVDWVAVNRVAPAVANMSLGGPPSIAVDDAVRNAIAGGVTVVVAAGNETVDACGVSPARTPQAVTVGSSTAADARSRFSNFGLCLDLFAPGSTITSAGIDSNADTAVMSGTSMASPHVAGVAAQILERTPGMTPAAVAAAIVGNATSGKVNDTRPGSPNRLLHAVFNPPRIQITGPVVFPDACGMAPVTTPFTVCNSGTGSLSLSPITSSSAQVAIVPPSSGFPITIAPGACFPFTARFTPVSPGSVSAMLTVLSDDPATPSLKVEAHANSGAGRIVTMVANSGRFGRVCSASKVFHDLPVTIANSGPCSLTISGIATLSADFLLPSVVNYPVTLAPGAAIGVSVRFQPSSPGAKSAELTITTDDPASPTRAVTVAGEAPEPYICESPLFATIDAAIGQTLGGSAAGDYTFNGKASVILPFGEEDRFGTQLSGEYIHHPRRREGEIEALLSVRRRALQFSFGGAVKDVTFDDARGSVTHVAFAIDLLHKKFRTGIFAAKYLHANRVFRPVDQLGGALQAPISTSAWVDAQLAYLHRLGAGAGAVGAAVQFSKRFAPGFASTIRVGWNDSFVQAQDAGSVMFGVTLGSWPNPEHYSNSRTPLGASVPRLRYSRVIPP